MLTLKDDLARLQRELDPPPPTPGPPPRAGYVRVKALVKFVDRDGRTHWPDAGAVDWMPEADRRVVLDEKKWAELVEA